LGSFRLQCFRPKHEAEARSIIAGLVPFLRDEGYTYFLRMFSAGAQARHASSRWNSKTRQVYSVEEEELVEFLSADDDLNLSDEPTMERENSKTLDTTNSNNPQNNDQVEFDVPQFTPTNFPSLNNDTDSVSTLHPNRPNSQQNRSFKQSSNAVNDLDSVSKLSDTASKISTLESSVPDLDTLFKQSFLELSSQAHKQAEVLQEQGEVLKKLLAHFHSPVNQQAVKSANPNTSQSDEANYLQTLPTGDPSGVAGPC
jgi:hypothetical protein